MPIVKSHPSAPTRGIIARAGRTIAIWSVGIAVAAGSAAPAAAATQGTLGTTSTGSITITATVANRAQLTGLTDVSFTAVDPGTTATAAQSDCVWSNTLNKGYTITATGSGTSNAFTIAAGAATVPYSVQWAATAGQTSGTALATGVASASLTSTATRPGCTSGPASSASLIVSIAAADLQTMVASTSYTGALTLVVTPQ